MNRSFPYWQGRRIVCRAICEGRQLPLRMCRPAEQWTQSCGVSDEPVMAKVVCVPLERAMEAVHVPGCEASQSGS